MNEIEKMYKLARVETNPYCCNTSCGEPTEKCKDCADCAMKQIAEKCKETINTMKNDSSTNAYAGGRCIEAKNVLKLLDVQEVE